MQYWTKFTIFVNLNQIHFYFYFKMAATYKDFQNHFQILAKKRPDLIINTLSNIFTMRLIGNKTHGDMAEIGIAEFVHQFMYDYDSKHVGKDLFRAKEHEEDILVIDELTKTSIPISLKAYGDGPLQLSTDKEARMFPELQKHGTDITDADEIASIFRTQAFAGLSQVNVMPLIYREDRKECNIMVFDFDLMESNTKRILYVPENRKYDQEKRGLVLAKGRSHPIFMFLDGKGRYICEVRYGGAAANALQRGFWTHTVNALPYFNSLTNGWISYSHNQTLVKLFKLALNATEKGHSSANVILQEDIDNLFKQVK